jgi:glutathione peroxidase-family protein
VSLRDIPVNTLAGQPSSLAELDGKTLLVVNVASKCGLTPQYSALEELHERFADQGFSVVGFPCNQFGGQEPGTADEIAEFCSATYGVTFPMFSDTRSTPSSPRRLTPTVRRATSSGTSRSSSSARMALYSRASGR